VTRDEIREDAKDAFREAFKDRFAKIAANEITMGEVEGRMQLLKTFRNLKTTYEQALQLIDEVFPA
jgi:hypothetical protein